MTLQHFLLFSFFAVLCHLVPGDRLLKELNPSVQGTADERSAKVVLEEDPGWFLSFGLVIVCGSGDDADVGAAVEQKLGKLLWEGEF
jgi:hypothetical protein